MNPTMSAGRATRASPDSKASFATRAAVWISTSRMFDCSGYKRPCGGLQREVIVHRVVRDLRRLVVADNRRERRHEHQGAVHIFLDLLQIWLRALDQELTEVYAAVRHDRDG